MGAALAVFGAGVPAVGASGRPGLIPVGCLARA